MNLKPGINHIELWVSDIKKSNAFYNTLFSHLGWHPYNQYGWSNGSMELYLHEEKNVSRHLSLGAHHICFHAVNRTVVTDVTKWLKSMNAKIFEGPKEMKYSKGYYTVGFYDPDGMILEVAHTPNMKF